MSRTRTASFLTVESLLYRQKIVIFAALVLFSVFAVFYIFQVSAMTKTAYTIGDREKSVEALQEQVRALEAGNTQGDYSKNISTLAERLRFEKIEGISYLRVLDQTVSVAKTR